MGKCNITADELAGALDITTTHLMTICAEFDADPNDDWTLTQGEHFEWATHGSRMFSAEGAVEICNYLEANQQARPLLTRWKRWLLQRDRRLKGLMVAKRVQEISTLKGQLVHRNGIAFLGPRACRDVLGLGTRQDVLKRTFKEIQTSDNTEIEPLKIDADFFESDEQQLYFSRSGLASVGKHLGTRLTHRHRQEWVQVVADYAPPVLEAMEKHEAARVQRINKAKKSVCSKAGNRCQITNRMKSAHKFNMTAHHLFDQHTYPQFADMEVNLIAIAEDIHQHFHQWMGGTKASCTVEDMERYVEEFGHSLFTEGGPAQAAKVAATLSNAKKMLRALL